MLGFTILIMTGVFLLMVIGDLISPYMPDPVNEPEIIIMPELTTRYPQVRELNSGKYDEFHALLHIHMPVMDHDWEERAFNLDVDPEEMTIAEYCDALLDQPTGHLW